MSTDKDSSDSDIEEKKDYNFIFRFIIFVFIAGPASVFAIGIYGRIGIRDAILAATERGSYSPLLILLLWVVGILGTAFMIFKR